MITVLLVTLTCKGNPEARPWKAAYALGCRQLERMHGLGFLIVEPHLCAVVLACVLDTPPPNVRAGPSHCELARRGGWQRVVEGFGEGSLGGALSKFKTGYAVLRDGPEWNDGLMVVEVQVGARGGQTVVTQIYAETTEKRVTNKIKQDAIARCTNDTTHTILHF